MKMEGGVAFPPEVHHHLLCLHHTDFHINCITLSHKLFCLTPIHQSNIVGDQSNSQMGQPINNSFCGGELVLKQGTTA